jgi:hypothetical protein
MRSEPVCVLTNSHMATYRESLTLEHGNAVLRACQGCRIAQVWQSVSPCIFLEVGRLRRKSTRSNNPSGQITFMIESDWRVEKPRSIHFGSGFSDRRIDKALPSLIGTRIIAVGLIGRLPELTIELDDGRVISTFTDWSNRPRWSIGFEDTKLFNLHPLPSDADITPWMCVQRGRLEIEYCYDDVKPALRKLFRRLGHA